MARKKREKELQPNIKVRLDRRTVITIRDRSKLEFWQQKYPKLEILEESYEEAGGEKEENKSDKKKAADKKADKKTDKKDSKKKK
jgi:hypothetical protein